MQDFVYSSQPARVVFGCWNIGTLAKEAERLSVDRVLVLSTPGQAEQAEAMAAVLGPGFAGLYPKGQMQTPVNVTVDALKMVERVGANAYWDTRELEGEDFAACWRTPTRASGRNEERRPQKHGRQ